MLNMWNPKAENAMNYYWQTEEVHRNWLYVNCSLEKELGCLIEEGR